MTAIVDTAIGGPTRPGPNRAVILAAVAALVLGGAWLLEAISERQAILYLIGAALGSLLVLPLLKAMDVTSATLLCGALALLGTACFRVFAGTGGERRLALLNEVRDGTLSVDDALQQL